MSCWTGTHLILTEFQCCLAWDYDEMPGLPRDLVGHELPIQSGFMPFKQPPRRMSSEVELKVKEEIERLLKAGFIRTARPRLSIFQPSKSEEHLGDLEQRQEILASSGLARLHAVHGLPIAIGLHSTIGLGIGWSKGALCA
ncbi:hypothetical protein RHSIM_Rhsim02G0049800 [Rhododendron simsii]|uniref:Uncharacterized protein n=1 Tax=Rhododendron simsii TaxID=118357 RepID=A0A834LVA7_RHOSS|nr:hypothetical protein RHSIM_Rhsim02G0049800 [Rhododendron simsii]